MRKLTNKGFGLKEFMTGLLFILVLGLLIFKVFVDNKEKNFTASKITSSRFADAVMVYKDKYYKGDGRYYLYELVESDFIGKVNNPIEGNNQCNIYDSFVLLQGTQKYVTLVCDNYLIEGIQNGPHKIYEFTSWQDTKENTNDSGILYNYRRNDEQILENYVSKNELVGLFNKKEGRSTDTVEEIKKIKNYEVFSKEMYRNKTLVKELS